jgi:ribosomal-protein-alanine N-acetyltransferase
VQFTFKPMTEEDAHQIAGWHYLTPYDFYDLDQDPEDLAELLDPQSWQAPKYTVFNEGNELVGFFSFRQDAQDDQMVEIGLGLRPDLTGKGFGFAFLTAGLTFGQEQFPAGKWSLRVATFNQRAIRVYERAGFIPLTTFLHHTNGGEYEFLRMIRPT